MAFALVSQASSESQRLAQELMIRKCEGAETKNNCWVGELLTIWTINLPRDRIIELKVL